MDELGPVPELEPVPVLGPPSDLRREIRARALIRTFTVSEKVGFVKTYDVVQKVDKLNEQCEFL